MSEFTGERVIPGAVEPDLWNEHISRYEFAKLFARGKRVLDVGCGAGYGAAFLSENAAQVAGFDISAEAIAYAKRHYPRAHFFVGSASGFPVASGSVDLITAFEVIEHVVEGEMLIRESARVLKRGGVFLVSTPNKTYYGQTRKDAGPNPFHVHEFELAEFEEALGRAFPFVRILAQNRQEAIVFSGAAAEERAETSFGERANLSEAHFFVAVCATERVDVPSLTYLASGGNLLRERERHIGLLDGQLSEARGEHLRLMAEHQRLHAELERQNAWALDLDRELDSARAELQEERADLQRERARLERLLQERAFIRDSRWVRLGRAFRVGPELKNEPE